MDCTSQLQQRLWCLSSVVRHIWALEIRADLSLHLSLYGDAGGARPRTACAHILVSALRTARARLDLTRHQNALVTRSSNITACQNRPRAYHGLNVAGQPRKRATPAAPQASPHVHREDPHLNLTQSWPALRDPFKIPHAPLTTAARTRRYVWLRSLATISSSGTFLFPCMPPPTPLPE